MPPQIVTVFGGTGFLGRRVVAGLAAAGFAVRAASRHPEPVSRDEATPGHSLPVAADVTDPPSIDRALVDSDAAVNCVSLYVQSKAASFQDVHVAGARNVAAATASRGARLVHISGIGADPAAASPYVRARGQGEAAVRAAHPGATILRSSVMFGPDDAFLRALDRIAGLTPVFPLFGAGATRLQPVHVEDVAASVVRAIERPDTEGRVFELGGADILTYRRIVERVLAWRGRRRLLLPMPFPVWDMLAALGRILPRPPVTEGQVALMKRDNVAAADAAGLAELDVTPRGLDAVIGT